MPTFMMTHTEDVITTVDAPDQKTAFKMFFSGQGKESERIIKNTKVTKNPAPVVPMATVPITIQKPVPVATAKVPSPGQPS